MKTFSLDELKELAAPEFDRHEVTEFFATTDGQLFFQEKFAKMNAGEGGTVHHLVKSDAAPVEENKPMTVKDLLLLIATLSDISVLETMLTAEKGLEKPRESAVKGIAARIGKVKEQLFLDDIAAIDDVEELKKMLQAERESEKPNELAIKAISDRVHAILLAQLPETLTAAELGDMVKAEQEKETPDEALINAINSRLLNAKQ